MAGQAFLHHVFIWLREAGAARDVADGRLRHRAGSYGVALIVEFTDSAAHDAYEIHADHLRFVAEFGPQFSRVVVYDVDPVHDTR